MTEYPILRVISKLLLPCILLFGLYVQFHGDFGPGGGFQAGVIFAAGFVLHGLMYGVDQVRAILPDAFVRGMSAFGVLLYAGTGVVCLLKGGAFLDYDVLAEKALDGQHWGIFTIELGVGITVAAVMILLFYNFTNR